MGTIRDTNNTTKKYLKLTNELGCVGHMLPILNNYKTFHHTFDILRDNSIRDYYSYTYNDYNYFYACNILSYLSISGD